MVSLKRWKILLLSSILAVELQCPLLLGGCYEQQNRKQEDFTIRLMVVLYIFEIG